MTESESLFHYESPDTYFTINDPTFTPVFLSTEDLNSTEAIEVCGNSQQCLFDFIASGGDVDFALQTMQNEQMYHVIIEHTQPGRSVQSRLYKEICFDKSNKI